MNSSEPIYMPHPGHFVGANDCLFFLTTYVNGVIVSTVGEYLPEARESALVLDRMDRMQRLPTSYRHYETAVFPAKKTELRCCVYRMASTQELEIRGYDHANEAFHGHREIVEKYRAMDLKGGSDAAD